MSRVKKLIFKPRQFFSDAIWKRSATIDRQTVPGDDQRKRERFLRKAELQAAELRISGKPTAILIGFSDWKTFMAEYLPNHNVLFFGHSPRVSEALIDTIRVYPDVTVYAWSYKWPDYLKEYCERNDIELVFVEDAFVRGVGLGVKKTKPLSLAFDKEAMHFDRTRPSELECLLATYDFEADASLMKEARQLANLLVENSITKYNSNEKASDLEKFLDSSRDERVLVLGQVEDDLSIRYGMPHFMSGNDLVRMAAIENPDAQILYRPHPEVAAVSKPHYSNPKDVANICQVMPGSATLHQCFDACTKVYAMTSLAGFEAILAGKPVKLFGNPFYSGWGFTEDAYPLERRKRKLTPLQVLAGAYILYPRYYHPVTNEPVSAVEGVRLTASLIRQMDATQRFRSNRSSASTKSVANVEVQALPPKIDKEDVKLEAFRAIQRICNVVAPPKSPSARTNPQKKNPLPQRKIPTKKTVRSR